MWYGLIFFMTSSLGFAQSEVKVYDHNSYLGVSHPWSFLLAYGLSLVVLMVLYFALKNNRSQSSKNWSWNRFLPEFFWSSFTWIVMGSLFVGSVVQDLSLGIFNIYEDRNSFGFLYYLFSFILIIALHDTFFYWTHRLLHIPWVYQKIHSQHHQSKTPTALSAYNFSIGEGFLHFMFLPLVLLFFPFHIDVVLFFLYFHSIYNLVIHSGINVVSGNNMFISLLAANNHHDIHHEKNRGNFGLYFNFWDKIMNTKS